MLLTFQHHVIQIATSMIAVPLKIHALLEWEVAIMIPIVKAT